MNKVCNDCTKKSVCKYIAHVEVAMTMCEQHNTDKNLDSPVFINYGCGEYVKSTPTPR